MAKWSDGLMAMLADNQLRRLMPERTGPRLPFSRMPKRQGRLVTHSDGTRYVIDDRGTWHRQEEKAPPDYPHTSRRTRKASISEQIDAAQTDDELLAVGRIMEAAKATPRTRCRWMKALAAKEHR